MSFSAGKQQSKLNTVAAGPSQLPGKCCNFKNCEMKRQSSGLKATIGTPAAARCTQWLVSMTPQDPGSESPALKETRWRPDTMLRHDRGVGDRVTLKVTDCNMASNSGGF